MKKISTGLIFLLILSFLLPISSFAHGNGGNNGNNGNDNKGNGSLTIHKYEQEPGVEKGDPDGRKITTPIEGKPLKDVTFKVVQTHEYSPEDDTWTEVENGIVIERDTNAEGFIHLPELVYGRYKVQETDGPEHVNINREEFFVDIPMTSADGSEIIYNVHIYPKNETIRNDVELTKIDGDSEDPMEGVKFALYDGKNNFIDFLWTDENGKLVADNLAHGDYYFKEKETLEGYVLGDQRYEFSIDDSTSNLSYTIENFKEPEVEKEVDVPASNRGETVTYSITSKFPGDIHEYTNYVITDVLDENLSYVDDTWSVTGADEDDFNFTHSDQTLKWEMKNFEEFEGVKEVTISFDALISEDAPANEGISNKANLEFRNKHNQGGDKDTNTVDITPTAGSLIVIKQDGDDNNLKLKGAEFELENLDTGEVFDGVSDENGVINFEELDYGVYELKETKAPMYLDDDGVEKPYNKLRNTREITINSNQSDQTIYVDNYKSGWELPQTGGIGTSIFTIVGLLLMGGAAYLFFRRRNKDVAQ